MEFRLEDYEMRVASIERSAKESAFWEVYRKLDCPICRRPMAYGKLHREFVGCIPSWDAPNDNYLVTHRICRRAR